MIVIPPALNRRVILKATASLLALCYKRDEALLFSTPDMSVKEASDLIIKYTPVEFRRAVRDSGGYFLYRGEAITTPKILSPKPDLLDRSTYNNMYNIGAYTYFTNLEKQLKTNNVGARPSTGHIGTTDMAAAKPWGNPVSVWPLGSELSYAWTKNRDAFYPGHCPDGDIVYDRDLWLALANGNKEVLFATTIEEKSALAAYINISPSSFIAIPARLDAELSLMLKKKKYGLLKDI
jgi:hypothetical protein